MAKEHLRSHTGLRGIAALMVAPVHMYCDEFVANFDRTVLPFLNSVLAVDVFFVLSGFILPYVYHDSEGNMNTSWRKFFGARFARIYPLHLLTIAIIGVMVLVASSKGIPINRPYYASDLPAQLFLLHAFPYVEKWAWIHPSWSISMEFLAYIAIFPCMAFAFRGDRPLAVKTAFIVVLCGLYGLTYWLCAASAFAGAAGRLTITMPAATPAMATARLQVHGSPSHRMAITRVNIGDKNENEVTCVAG